MSNFNFTQLIDKQKRLSIDDLSPEDVDLNFSRILKENDIEGQIEVAENPQEVVDSAYKTLNLVIDIHERFGEHLTDEHRLELESLIENDAYALIAGRTTKDEYSLNGVYSQFEKAADLPVDSRLRDAIALGRSLDILGANETIETGIHAIAQHLPSSTTRTLLEAIEISHRMTNELSFEDIYKELNRRKRLGLIASIEHLGQRLTLTPEDIRIGEKRGDLLDPFHKERNFVRKTGTNNTVIGDVALKLSKRFRR